MEEQFVKLSDEQLCQKTEVFRKRLSEGESIDLLLPEAFATAREAAKRVYDMRPLMYNLLVEWSFTTVA